MVAPTILPGRAFQGTQKTSDLPFHWRASDLSLTALTGQAATFTRASGGGLVQGTGSRHWRDTDNQLRLSGPAPDQLERWEWVQNAAGTYVPALRLEGQRINLALQSETLGTTWNATNITVANNQVVAPDGHSTAESLTASAGNGTLIQDLGVIGSTATNFSIWLKRLTGTGDIDLTLDNGATWTTKTITSEWARYSITQTLANPDCGVRIVTSGDAVYAWGGQAEAGAFASTYIPTVGSTVARADESLWWTFEQKPTAMTGLLTFVEAGTAAGSLRLFHIGAAATGTDPRLAINAVSSKYRFDHDNGSSEVNSQATVQPSIGDAVELRFTLGADGAVQLHQAINGGAEVSGTASAALALQGAWAATRLWLNAGSGIGFSAHRSVKIAHGIRSLSFMREVF